MANTKDELTKKTPCVCSELPCIHNPEISEDVKVFLNLVGHRSKKGLVYIYLPKKKYQIVEETNDLQKVRVYE